MLMPILPCDMEFGKAVRRGIARMRTRRNYGATCNDERLLESAQPTLRADGGSRLDKDRVPATLMCRHRQAVETDCERQWVEARGDRT